MKVIVDPSALAVSPSLAEAVSGSAPYVPVGWTVERLDQWDRTASDGPVLLIGGAAENAGPHVIHVPLPEGASHWEALWDLPKYPGLSGLLAEPHRSQADYVRLLLDRYQPALSRLKQGEAAVFGAQRLGLEVCAGLKGLGVRVSSLIDNNSARWGTEVQGYPIRSLDEIKDKTLPIIIGTTKHTHSISHQLRTAGFTNILPYPVLTLLNPTLFPDEIPYRGLQEDFEKNIGRYVSLFVALADERSRRVLDGLICYRTTYDTDHIAPIADDEQLQYFDPNIIRGRLGNNEVFVDSGAFDGDTARKFMQVTEERYRSIYLFEPDRNLMARAKDNLKTAANINYVEAGAYSEDGVLSFSATGTTNGSFTSDGDLQIPVRRIDTAVPEAPSMIKMDIEGAEGPALMGAERSIKKNHPKLAIAVYHKGEDLWGLPALIQHFDPNYQIYLRHYSPTGLETVVYAV